MAITQELQLETLDLEYSRFVKDQVLTEVQLNEIIDFFEDQHRITRTCLIGTGIVCGLHLKRVGNVIKVSHGCAITTDGDLLKIKDTDYNYFAEYLPPDNVHYDPFYYQQAGEEKRIKLYQLVPDDEKDDITAVDVFKIESELDKQITDWVAILYIEYYLKDQDKCTPTNCDHLGRRQVARPKVLLLSKADMDKIIHLDAGEIIGDDIYLNYYDAYNKYFTFPVIREKRVALDYFNTTQSDELAKTYFKIAKDGSAALSKAILDLYNAFQFILDKTNYVNINALVNKLTSVIASESNALHAQYTYDFYKDVIVAYNELRELLYNVAFECCPNIYAFPKHIMLGEPNAQYGPLPPKYRHQFYPSPIISNHKVKVNVAIGMLDRLKLMIDNFGIPSTNEIKITPSKDYNESLENRAIPFYYKQTNYLVKKWKYGKTLRAHEEYTLSYNAYQYTSKSAVLHPLKYSIDEYNFFRIEGHIGKGFDDVLKTLNSLKQSNGVPIDIVAVLMGEVKDIDISAFECQFEDLYAVLHAFQVEIKCLFSDGARFFSGFTANVEAPHINLKRYIAAADEPQWRFSDAILAKSKELIGEEVQPLKAMKKASSEMSYDINTSQAYNTTAGTVEKNIETDDGVFGKYYAQAITMNVQSVDEFSEKTRMVAVHDKELNKLNDDQRNIVFEYPMQIIGHLYYMQRFVPDTLKDVSDTFIADYKTFTSRFCLLVNTMRVRLERYFGTGNYRTIGYERLYLSMLDRMEALCCDYKKLEVIILEIARRKKKILESLAFTNYADNHSGLEHKAGTHRGGTFVIVYSPQKTVIADFCLPYICCSDCPPIAYIMPKQKVYLALPKTTACSDEVSGNFQFKVEPPEGVVKVTDNKLVNTVVLQDSKYFFNPQAVLADYFGKEITFTVDDQYTDCKIVVYKHPDAKIDYKIVKESNAVIQISLTGSSNEVANEQFSYNWNLGDGQTNSNKAIDNVSYDKINLDKLGLNGKIPVSLKVTNGNCSGSVSVDVPYKPHQDVSLKLSKDKACTNDQPLLFDTYSPKGATIESKEANEAIVNGDKPSFNPALVKAAQFGKPITFTVGGEPTNCTVIVTAPVALDFGFESQKITDDTFDVLFTNKTDESKIGVQQYLWKFGDGILPDVKQTGAQKFTLTFDRKKLIEKQINSIAVTLSIQNDPCNATKVKTIFACGVIVNSFMLSNIAELSSDIYKKNVKEAANGSLTKIHPAVQTLFSDAKENLANPKPSQTRALLTQVSELLGSLSRLKLTENEKAKRIGEDLFRRLVKLMLELIRCDDKADAQSLTIIKNVIENIHGAIQTIQGLYPQLNANNVLLNYLTNFRNSFVSQNPDLIKALTILIKDLVIFK